MFCQKKGAWKRHSPNASTTPLWQWVFWQCLPFSWTTQRSKHCRHSIAVMGVVDTFGPNRFVIRNTNTLGPRIMQFLSSYKRKWLNETIFQSFNLWMIKFTIKKAFLHLSIWQNWCLGQLFIQEMDFSKLLCLLLHQFLHIAIRLKFLRKKVQRVFALCYFWDLEKVALAKNGISKIFILCAQ